MNQAAVFGEGLQGVFHLEQRRTRNSSRNEAASLPGECGILKASDRLVASPRKAAGAPNYCG
ncbi:MAG: hypothetical protein DVS81_13235 [Candidatus Accumulibacter meliphilus]|uniref:Uncharacterized protein n=1 Tax=Candidatus Accumulibacter meliphilus TaxID=2211374 RepID=A0A369XRU3_9PROT|nr:MAG: hypothetical protein DVS81_13235 [Candidatus Accumulibacter meliphilus]